MTDRSGARRLVIPRLALAAVTLAAAPARGQSPNEATDALRDAARALLADHCLSCHAGGAPKGGLDLIRRASALKGGDSGEALAPGRPEESLLVEKVAGGEMPPKAPLAPEAVVTLTAWVRAGAPYGDEPLAPRRAGRDWWSLRPVKRPAVPEGAEPWVRNPVDAFVLPRLRALGLSPAPEADRVTLIRRVTFDLTGLPPTPEEVAAFEAEARPDAYERCVERLLASPRYGERWGRHWLDAVRFGDSHGYEMNQPRPNAWVYRDFVIRAFNRDTPLPRFALEQLAGDTLPDGDGLTQSATGFLVAGAHDQVGNATPEGVARQRADDLDDMVSVTGSAFLGLSVGCARCHDHKFDPIPQRDYYALAAVFAGVTHADREVPAPDAPARRAEAARVAAELAEVKRRIDATEPPARPDADAPLRPAVRPGRNVERFEPVAARGVRFTVLATNDGSEPCLDELEAWTVGDGTSPSAPPRNVALAEAGGVASASSEFPGGPIHKVAHLNDGRTGNGRSWISNVKGRGQARVAWPEPAVIDRVVWGRDREGKYLDRLAVSYVVEVERADAPPGRWQVVASSSDRAPATQVTPPVAPAPVELRVRRDELARQLGGLKPTQTAYAGTFVAPGATHLLRRGDPLQKGEPVAPGALSAVAPPLTLPADAPEADRRAALGRWLGDPENPLTPRVMVNRVWMHHFGRGLVATPGDFGFNGAPPTHPDLLDWLAAAYRDGGFRLKPLHRLIVTSSAYRQSGRADAKGLALDRDARFLWRFPPRRLEAEAIRDAVLAVSGALDPRMGGPGYSVWRDNTNYVHVYAPKDDLGPAEFRRMVYRVQPRSRLDPVFGAFDCPDAALAAPRRNVSTTPLQALNLWNSRFLLDQSARLAARLRNEAGPDPAAQIDRAFRLAFGRPPTAAERDGAVALVRDHGPAALGRALFNANEFVYLP